MPSTSVKLARPTILLVPSMSVFSVVSLEHYYRKFIDGQGIEAVTLPLIEDSGFYFPYEIDDTPREGQKIDEEGSPGERLIQLREVVDFFLSKGIALYFTLDLSMSKLSLASGACDIRDQIGNRSAHCCINNNLAQRYIALILSQALELFNKEVGDQLKGVAIHVTSLWPMGASTGRFLVTCFCTDCVQTLRELTHNNLDPAWFRLYPNGINLALAEVTILDEDGIEHGGIQYVKELTPDMPAEEVLDACSQLRGTLPALAYDQGTFGQQKNDFVRKANRLMLYLRAKSELSFHALRKLFSHIRTHAPNAARILIGEGESYDWTSGLFNNQLNRDLADELWLPITSLHLTTTSRLRPILARRSCYLVNSFLSALHKVADPELRAALVTNPNPKLLRKTLQKASDEAMSELQREGDAILPEAMASRPEAVVVGIDRELADALIKRVMATQSIHPTSTG